MNTNKQQQRGDANLAIHTAAHFFELAGKFFGALPVDKAAFHTVVNQPENIGRLITASTNLGLSIELYLKGIALMTKGTATITHNLLTLFKDLPGDVQDSIKQRYSRRFNHAPKSKLRTIDFYISTQNQLPASVEKRAPILSDVDQQDVCKVLEVEKDAFQTWRYVYEQAPAAGWSRVTVHYAHLCIVVNSIQDQFKPAHDRP